MSNALAFLVTSGLLLLPLIPAAILYLALTPRGGRQPGTQANRAKGDIGAGAAAILGFRLQFNVVGSSATYIVLLAAATLIQERLAEDYAEQEALRDRQAWLVEVPVRLKDQNNQNIPADNGELQQVRVELEPALTQASASTIQFWVVPNNGRFPSARFNISTIGLRPAVIDLNDQSLLEHDYAARRMTGIGPVWIELGPAYGAP